MIPTNDATAAAAVDAKVDRWAHVLTVAGSLLHDVGALLLRKRNEQLADAVAASDNRANVLVELISHGYHLGRAHELAGVPVPENIPGATAEAFDRMARDHYAAPADVDEHQDQAAAPADVSEHQDQAAAPADVSEHQDQAPAAAVCDHGLPTSAPGLCNHDEMVELGDVAPQVTAPLENAVSA